MKRQQGEITQHLAAFMLGVFLISSPTAQAAPNQGTGDVNGDGNALVDSNVFDLFNIGALTLVKTAFLTSDGTQLTSGAILPTGTMVDFMIYVNNAGSVDVSDTSIQDVLDPLFVYQPNSIRLDNNQTCAGATCIQAEEVTMYGNVSVLAALTDAAGAGDSVSYDGTDTIDVGNSSEALNDQQDATAGDVLVLVFTVQVQ